MAVAIHYGFDYRTPGDFCWRLQIDSPSGRQYPSAAEVRMRSRPGAHRSHKLRAKPVCYRLTLERLFTLGRDCPMEEIMATDVMAQDGCAQNRPGSSCRSGIAWRRLRLARDSLIIEKPRSRFRWLSAAAAAAMLLGLASGNAVAQINFDPASYQALAPASSSESIPLGTRITRDNWTTYRKFLPIGVQALFSQKYPLRMGSDPGFAIEVGPTIHIPLPSRVVREIQRAGPAEGDSRRRQGHRGLRGRRPLSQSCGA